MEAYQVTGTVHDTVQSDGHRETKVTLSYNEGQNNGCANGTGNYETSDAPSADPVASVEMTAPDEFSDSLELTCSLY